MENININNIHSTTTTTTTTATRNKISMIISIAVMMIGTLHFIVLPRTQNQIQYLDYSSNTQIKWKSSIKSSTTKTETTETETTEATEAGETRGAARGRGESVRRSNRFSFPSMTNNSRKEDDDDDIVLRFQEKEGTVVNGNQTESHYKNTNMHTNADAESDENLDDECSRKKWIVMEAQTSSTLLSFQSLTKSATTLLQDWCMVIVANDDNITTPSNFNIKKDKYNIHLLSPEQQNRWLLQNFPKQLVLPFLSYHHHQGLNPPPPPPSSLLSSKNMNKNNNNSSNNNPGHMSRKNIGYLYAIHHGASMIFDFDANHAMAATTAASPLLNETHLERVHLPILTQHLFNPYPILFSPTPTPTPDCRFVVWPRGFPPSHAINPTTHGIGGIMNKTFSLQTKQKIGVVQTTIQNSLDLDQTSSSMINNNNNNPDFVHTMDTRRPVLSPLHAYVPYNAHGTIHTSISFWAMFLPYTMTISHSPLMIMADIWRSYISERLFQDLNIRVAIVPPQARVKNNKNNNNINSSTSGTNQTKNHSNHYHDHQGRNHSVQQMNDENNFYQNIDELIDFLDQWDYPSSSLSSPYSSPSSMITLPAMMERLWYDLYKAGHIPKQDVLLLQSWLDILIHIGYAFPNVQRRRIRNVVIMGQFNFVPKLMTSSSSSSSSSSLSTILFWVQKWKEVFHHVVIRGPFDTKSNNTNTTDNTTTTTTTNNNATTNNNDDDDLIRSLLLHGVKAYIGKDDGGTISPIHNLLRTVQQYNNDTRIDGILYLHDDALLNLHVLEPLFNNRNIIASYEYDTSTYLNGHTIQQQQQQKFTKNKKKNLDYVYMHHSESAYTIHSDDTFESINGNLYKSYIELMKKELYYWDWWNHCIPRQHKLFHDPRSNRYKQNITSINNVTTTTTNKKNKNNNNNNNNKNNNNDDTNEDRSNIQQSLLIPSPGQSDFLYIPKSLFHEFIRAATLVSDYNLFLECGFPLIVQMLRDVANNTTNAAAAATNTTTNITTVQRVPLCTSWEENRNHVSMIAHCENEDKKKTKTKKKATNNDNDGNDGNQYGVFHPFKLSFHGMNCWNSVFDYSVRLRK